MNIFEDIKKFREANNLTQKQLSDICGVTLRTVQNWEAGKNVPNNILRLLQSIAPQGVIISPSANTESNSGNINSSVAQHVKGTGHHISGTGNISEGVPTTMLQQALNEITEMRKLLADEMRNNNEQIERLISLLEKK